MKLANVPVRWLAEGRDASETLDADNAGFGKNEGATPSDEQGSNAWRVFYTRQHGDNTTWEVVRP